MTAIVPAALRLLDPRARGFVVILPRRSACSRKELQSIITRSLMFPAAAVLVASLLTGCAQFAWLSSKLEALHTAEVESHGGEGGMSAGVSQVVPDAEESGTPISRGGTYDRIRAGARLSLSYDPATSAFTGTVSNTTGATLSRVRVEVHLSTGTELGPTNPVDIAPGQTIDVTLDARGETFSTWTAHPEVGGAGAGEDAGASDSEEQGEGAGEHGSGSEGSGG